MKMQIFYKLHTDVLVMELFIKFNTFFLYSILKNLFLLLTFDHVIIKFIAKYNNNAQLTMTMM